MAHTDQLPIPPEAKRDPHSFEIVRIWVANRAQHLSLRTGVWQDPAAYGIMLCDLMKHIANSLQNEGWQQQQAFDRIKAGLFAELDSPTDLSER